MRTIATLLAAILAAPSTAPLAAQPAKDGPLHDDFLREYAQTRGYMSGRPVQPKATPDDRAVLFLRSPARSNRLSLYEFDVATGKTRLLLDPEKLLTGGAEKLSAAEKAVRERMRLSAAGFASFHLSPDGAAVLLPFSGKLYLLDRASGKVEALPTGPGPLLDPKFAPDGAHVSYVRDHDVHVLDLKNRKETRVTRGGTETVPHGLAEFVAQEEMGRFSGYWWSPDGTHLAYQESDHTDVETWYVADPTYPGTAPTPFRYPRPGKNNVQVRLGIVSVKGGPTRWVEWNRKNYPYLATVRWNVKGKGPLVVVQNRAQTEAAVLEVDPATGKARRLLLERDPTWVNLFQEVPRWLKNGQGFLWVSERDGGPQLELRGPNGRLRRVLFPAHLGYRKLLSVDEGHQHLYVQAGTDPTQAHLYRASLADDLEEPVLLTQEDGLHTAVFSKTHGLQVRTARLLQGMPRTTVHRADGEKVGTLPAVAVEPKVVPRVDLLTIGKRSFRAAVVFPRAFDPRKRYPVLVDVYGGPHHLHVLAARDYWLLKQWYADQGFLVVAVDGRGTPGRGRDWERAIHQRFGSVPLEDQVAGLQALGERYPALDLKRVGISGWSFGGYMGALAVLRRPAVFHAGIAGAPVCDWYDYDTHYTERYLGVPPEAEAAYREGSLLTYADKLRRPLLILHGTADDNVYFRHSLKLGEALFRAGRPFAMVPLSGLTHMRGDPVVVERLHQRIVEFLKRNLPGE